MIPYVDLQAQYQSIKPEIDAAVCGVLRARSSSSATRWRVRDASSPRTAAPREAVAVNIGTGALHLALLAAGVGPGDEVITVPYTFVATVAGHRATRAPRPVFVDVEPGLLHDGRRPAIEAAITPRTKAIMPVHLYGQPADMDPILDDRRRHGLSVIEDAAQAHGAEYKGRRCGSMGDMAAASASIPGKNLGRLRRRRRRRHQRSRHGAARSACCGTGARRRRYEHKSRAFNYRMDGIQGAMLGVKLKHLEAWTEARRAHAAEYARRSPTARARHAGERAGVPARVSRLRRAAAAPRCDARAAAEAPAFRPACTIRSRCTCSRPTRPRLRPRATFPCRRQCARGAVAADLPELTAAQVREVASAVRAADGGSGAVP